MVYNEPLWYRTSQMGATDTVGMTDNDRAGNLYVMTSDTIQENFYAFFRVWRNKETKEYVDLQSTNVNILPYHRIYDFEASEEIDSTGTFTGNNLLSWRIKNPTLKDIIDGDYFVIERATDSAFTDAEQLTVQPMKRDESGIYSFPDESRTIWSGNIDEPDTVNEEISRKVTNYTIYDWSGTPVYVVDLDLHSDKVVSPSKPVYYRIARASANVWGWDSEFAHSVKMYKNNYLAPLADKQEAYTKDVKYNENRKVNFRVKLDNAEVTPMLTDEALFDLSYTKVQNLKEKVIIHSDFENPWPDERVLEVYVTYPDKQGASYILDHPMDIEVDNGARVSVQFRFIAGNNRLSFSTKRFDAIDDMQLKVTLWNTSNGRISSVEAEPYDPETGGTKDYLTESRLAQLKDSIYAVFKQEYESSTVYGRCMWDRTARLVLIRTLEETGQQVEIIIPQDSIKRQADGSWLACFSDVADKACTHYSYAVRIDQSSSDLHVLHPETQLQPKALTGPNLYFDEGAEIKSFTATQGDARPEMKRGVMLNWVPTNMSVDEYVLQRRPKNSDVVAETIYTGLETSFFDETAAPNQHYEYIVTANFNCNGKGTSNSATTEGWRTPYGEISGTIVLMDNSGMKGVEVTLSKDGEVIRQMTTDATGIYRFDSLEYDITNGTDYTIVPTNEYARFSYNSTDAQSTTIKLSADNAIASGINFMNMLCARVTGRILYKNSTVPVAGAMFLLNGDTIRSNGAPLKSGIDGNFEILVAQRQPNRLQVFKPGHTFEGDGILRVEGDEETFALEKALDGIRFYDLTKVRLVGRVAGGNDQKDTPEAFGLGRNNLGEDLQLVLQLEGDNTAHFVHDPNDLTRDTLMAQFAHVVYNNDPTSAEPERVVGTTRMITEKKRIIIRPDSATGEFEVDLFPVKYKVTQATAKGYATLFGTGQGNETFDLTNAPLTILRDTFEKENVAYNATYDRIYHNPVQVQLVQFLYGWEREGYGEPEIETSDLNPNKVEKVALYTVDKNKNVTYTLGYPVFYANRKYQFKAKAYEEFRYNNNPTGKVDRVPQRGGHVIVRNGLQKGTKSESYELDKNGENRAVWLDVNEVDVENAGTNALRNVSVALETEGNIVETNVFSAFVAGTVIEEKSMRGTEADIQILDIIRDPGGAGSSAWVESGATYTFSYITSTKVEAGVTMTPTYGKDVEQYIGIVEAPQGTGSYLGRLVQTQKAYSWDIPLTVKFDYGEGYTYSLTTNEKVSTSSSQTPSGVGIPADLFFGTTVGMLAGKAKTISVIGDSLYEASQPARNAGTMLALAHGTDSTGQAYHLVTGTKYVTGSYLNNTFAYTYKHIIETLIPRLAIERQSLLQVFTDSAQAQATADALGEPVYWYFLTGSYVNDTIPVSSYKMFCPKDGGIYVDEVSALNKSIAQWLGILVSNEEDKVKARMSGMRVGTYSTSNGTTYQHSDTYNSSFSYNEYPLFDAVIRAGKTAGGQTIAGLFKTAFSRTKDLAGTGESPEFFKFTETAMDAMHEYFYNDASAWVKKEGEGYVFEEKWTQKKIDEVATKAGEAKFSFKVKPVFNMSGDKRLTQSVAQKKTQGFTLAADPSGDISVSVYRATFDTIWDNMSEGVLEQVRQTNNDLLRYGSYVFYTEGGATMCPHEDAQTTVWYNPGTLLGNGTEWVAKPELTADSYEVANVAPDKRATFRIQLRNQGQVDTGTATDGAAFYLYLDGSSNPDGAKVYINGAPLLEHQFYWILPGSPITQTLEVERGTVDDYNLKLVMYVDGCYKTKTTMNLAAHFIPLSTDVAVSMPRQNWVMNTLSPRDSAGYYLPITIDGFDIHHKNFDHIEFQYKLSTQSDDDWVTQCSFFANDSLYAIASGSKAMIENGQITPFRFYGERDPMEQRYDLRAVSFCRYGSGFVTKNSPVISGTKDTRPPRVFGEPEPANSILGVGDNLKLRFNEPIAGNYLDEDNNFQLLGVTNEVGITATTALHFDVSNGSMAQTKATRNIIGKSFTVDMMIRPAKVADMQRLFSAYSEQTNCGIEILLTADNSISVIPSYPNMRYQPIFSKPLGEIKSYMRVLVVWDKEEGAFRMYAGSTDKTNYDGPYRCEWPAPLSASVLTFGEGYTGDMLEARVWLKALTPDEIAATNDHYLTGYERELGAYYRMNEGRGDIVKDHANGATLYLDKCSWNKHKGFSAQLAKEQRLQLAGNLLGRSKAYDATYMLWFRTSDAGAESANLFSAGRTDEKHGLQIGLESGAIVLHSDSLTWRGGQAYNDGDWHHVVFAINRTYNNAALYMDGNMVLTIPAEAVSAIQGAMYLGGNFEGNIDEFAVTEQALPKSLIEAYDNIALGGDEMGLIAYLPFEEQQLNANGVLEQVFSINDRRQYRDPLTLEVIEKVVPLVTDPTDFTGIADKTDNAPVSDHGQLTKLNFDWSFNGDELLINLNMLDREINKKSIYVTVRDVEDLNGNPMASPVTRTAFVDRNSLKWGDDDIEIHVPYGAQNDDFSYINLQIVNSSGKRHSYTIESLPDWLSVDAPRGTIQPTEKKAVVLHFNVELPVGIYSDLIYLTDEDGLAEPLLVELHVDAYPPYENVDLNKYPLNMSLCGQVMIGDSYDTDENDIVYALYRNECVGLAHITADANSSALYLMIHGLDEMNRKPIRFQLWQASTGKIYDLRVNQNILFVHGAVNGCGTEDPVILSTGGSQTQNIELNKGWTWISSYLFLQPSNALISKVMSANEPWTEGDIIKNPATQHFVSYSDSLDNFVGQFNYLRYIYTYMMYCKEGNTMYIYGDLLPEDSLHITVAGGGQWSPMPCLFDQRTPVAEALAGYYDQASVGDMIKAHDRFATFSKDKKWVGDLETLLPGEGYFFRRMAPGSVDIAFFKQSNSNAPKRAPLSTEGASPLSEASPFSNPNAATNMTMIAKMSNDPINDKMVNVFIGDELVCEAKPLAIGEDTYYFLTIQSDRAGAMLRFQTEDGTPLQPVIPTFGSEAEAQAVIYRPDAHLGSLKAPVRLQTGANQLPYKMIENDHVVIIRNNEKYSITGAKLQ